MWPQIACVDIRHSDFRFKSVFQTILSNGVASSRSTGEVRQLFALQGTLGPEMSVHSAPAGTIDKLSTEWRLSGRSVRDDAWSYGAWPLIYIHIYVMYVCLRAQMYVM